MDTFTPVEPSWFRGPTLDVAERLLGMTLVHDSPDGLTAALIVEVEAYRGPEDRGAHSYGGRRTQRTEVMFGEAGYAYVFHIYGMHYCFNVVTAGRDQPEAVLVRAAEPLAGLPLMAARRGIADPADADARRLLTSGPGRLTQALGIRRIHYGHPLWEPPLFIAPGRSVTAADIARGPRVNIGYAGEWADRPWRLWIRGNAYVSRA
jgi:DNA-3-methyladenine glycosylase